MRRLQPPPTAAGTITGRVGSEETVKGGEGEQQDADVLRCAMCLQIGRAHV